jgi:hypothetical protein
MKPTEEQVDGEIWQAVSLQKIDLTSPENSFIVAMGTRRGWNLDSRHRDLGSALDDARRRVMHGNPEVYVLRSASRGVLKIGPDGRPTEQSVP